MIGGRTEIEGGHTKIGLAKALHAQEGAVLSLQPDHPGAQHLLGRLHAAIMRMNRVRRFLATKVLGRGALASASWQEAQRLLEAAASGDPCIATTITSSRSSTQTGATMTPQTARSVRC
ncbi:MAG: hypothetical protein MK486_07160 [Gemmatimonadetes bacterium]|nr:hypothetical protein [Gemmatimonadota bacterium]